MGALANAAPVPQSLRLFLTITHPAPKNIHEIQRHFIKKYNFESHWRLLFGQHFRLLRSHINQVFDQVIKEVMSPQLPYNYCLVPSTPMAISYFNWVVESIHVGHAIRCDSSSHRWHHKKHHQCHHIRNASGKSSQLALSSSHHIAIYCWAPVTKLTGRGPARAPVL